MDDSRFDALSRAFADGHSRRGLTRLLGSLALGGALARLGVAESVAKKKHKSKKKACPPCKKRRKGKCKGLLPDGTACSGGTCRGGNCMATVPPPPPPVCTTNAECSGGQVCVAGACVDCTSFGQCTEGRFCGAGGRCLGFETCANQATCFGLVPGGIVQAICNGNENTEAPADACVLSEDSYFGDCVDDGDCVNQQTCLNACACITNACVVTCAEQADCPNTYACIAGLCFLEQ
jgi:hypothetical protein